MFQPFPPPNSYSLKELQDRIEILKNQDFLPIFGKKRNAAFGESLENYLGLSNNNSRLADWGNYELKTNSQGLNSKISLFNASWIYNDDFSARKLVKLYGKDHHSKHLGLPVLRLDRIISYSSLPFDNLYINFDMGLNNLNLRYSRQYLASIDINNLKKWFKLKLKNLALIRIKKLTLKETKESGFRIISMIVLENSSFKRFIKLVEEDQIQLSFRMMLVQPGTKQEIFKNRGSGFRAKQSILEKLYTVRKIVV